MAHWKECRDMFFNPYPPTESRSYRKWTIYEHDSDEYVCIKFWNSSVLCGEGSAYFSLCKDMKKMLKSWF